jgi:hypothetical protein
MAREQAMFAVLHCGHGVGNQSFKNKCRNGPGLRNGADTFEEATTLCVQCLTMLPIHENRSRIAFLNALNERFDDLNERGMFLFHVLFHFYGRNTKP